MSYWLMKSEPDEFSIDDLVRAPGKTTLTLVQAGQPTRDGIQVDGGPVWRTDPAHHRQAADEA